MAAGSEATALRSCFSCFDVVADMARRSRDAEDWRPVERAVVAISLVTSALGAVVALFRQDWAHVWLFCAVQVWCVYDLRRFR